jgi:hypothetical protein
MSAPTRRSARLQKQARRRSAPARLLLGAAAAAGAVIVGIVAGGGTFAVWNSSASVASAATLRAGSSSLTVTPLALSADGLYPGRTVYAPSTVRNTGTTPLALSLDAVTGPQTATAFTSAVAISAGMARSTADCTAGRVTSPVTANVGTAPRASLMATVAPGASGVVCVGLGLPANAPASAAGAAASALTLSISGTQVRS